MMRRRKTSQKNERRKKMKTQTIFATLLFIALCGVSAFAQKATSENPAKQPFYKTLTNPDVQFGPVPAGKVLVLEFVSGRAASGESGTGGVALYTYYQGAFESFNMFAASNYTEHVSSNKTYITQPVKIYIPAGRIMQLRWEGDVTPVFYMMTISGHYVDVP
jgi:hypothetical protein